MFLVKITCPKCGTEGGFSISQSSYKGPYKCWKCREIFNVELEGHELISCKPLSVDEAAQIARDDEMRKQSHRGA
jgi:transposase-like protein